MPQIIPIKELKNTSKISDMCHGIEEPIYITKDGYVDMVIMSMEFYESTMKQFTTYRNIEISEKRIKEGKVKDAGTVLREIREKQAVISKDDEWVNETEWDDMFEQMKKEREEHIL